MRPGSHRLRPVRVMLMGALVGIAASTAAAASGPTVASVTLQPSSIAGGSGASSTGTVTLSAPAPSGGTAVTLSSSLSALAALPPSVTVAGGQTSATFTVITNPQYRDYSGLAFSPVIAASANGGARSATLFVSAQKPPADITNDTADRHGTVCGGAFPATSGEKGILYTCFAGPTPGTAGMCTFNQECLGSGCEPQSSGGTFSFNDSCGTGTPYPISDSPSVVVGASSATGTVTSYFVAPSGGTTTTITDGLSCVTVPFNVTIPQSKTSASFSISNTDTSVGRFVPLGVTISSSTMSAAQLGLTWYAVLPSGSCKADTCAAHGYNCGIFDDGCCGQINCGTCSAPDTCGGGGTVGVCGCTPSTCASQGFLCGTAPDNCGGTLNCGTCPTGQSCNLFYHFCQSGCQTCAGQAFNCGTASDGCGGTLRCGKCKRGQTCANNVCQ